MNSIYLHVEPVAKSLCDLYDPKYLYELLDNLDLDYMILAPARRLCEYEVSIVSLNMDRDASKTYLNEAKDNLIFIKTESNN